MNVLVACECSGRIKTAFRKRGHNAWSCDLKPSELEHDLFHLNCDMRLVVGGHFNNRWDLLIAHPDCTYLSVSGARWWKSRQKEQKEAIEFVKWIYNLPILHIAIENPIGKLSTTWRKPDQIIQPYHFGDAESKATCLWLKNLPPLIARFTGGEGIKQSTWREPPSAQRKTNRARTYQGIAEAMAEQWGNLL